MRWITDRTLVRTLLLVASYLRAAPLQALPRCWLGSRRAPRTLQRQRQYRVAGWRGPGSGLTWFSCLPAFPRPFPTSQVPVNPPPPQPPGVFQCFWSDPKTRFFSVFSGAVLFLPSRALIKDIGRRTNLFVPPSLAHETSWATLSITNFVRSALTFQVRKRVAVILILREHLPDDFLPPPIQTPSTGLFGRELPRLGGVTPCLPACCCFRASSPIYLYIYK